MNTSIAIIGIAGRFPEADHIEALYQNLRDGRDSIRTLSRERMTTTSLPPKNYRPLGYLEDIDKFDHKFFNISLREAEHMDPHQRLLLEQAYHAFESSGYSIEHFDGSKTAVFLAAVQLTYHRHAEKFDPTLLTGNLNAATAGRIAQYFNLRGNAVMVDTACSSSLVAVHMACNELLQHEADYVLAGGASLSLFPAVTDGQKDIGTTSRDGKTRSFSAKADGSGAGEAVACVLLKRLDDAVRDNDLIYGVIRGAAVNQDARLSGSLTAPSSRAQAEVIWRAWEKAAVDPTTIASLEAHGSATQLGDPIELEGLEQAFGKFTDRKQFCAVSSIKSNFGHAGNAAGICGLAKAVLGLRHRVLFPSLHFDAPNPFVDFENLPVYVNGRAQPWETPEGTSRRAGVSSFGLSGTNCHVVLEEAPAVAGGAAAPGRPYLFTVSAKSAESLRRTLEGLAGWLGDRADCHPADVSHTLTAGRKHYNYRFAAVAGDVAGLLAATREPGAVKHLRKEFKKLLLVFSGHLPLPGGATGALEALHPAGKQAADRCRNAAPLDLSGGQAEKLDRFCFQYACFHLLRQYGIRTNHLLGAGVGRYVVDAITGELTLAEAIAGALADPEAAMPDFEARLARLLEAEAADENVLFLEMGPQGRITDGLKSVYLPALAGRYEVLSLAGAGEASLPALFKALYLAGYPVDWEQWGRTAGGRKVWLPPYPFERKRCWVKEMDFAAEAEAAPAAPAAPAAGLRAPRPSVTEELPLQGYALGENWSETEKKIAAIWLRVLKLKEIELHDDFYQLGGHSLFGVQVMSLIQREFGIKINFRDVFALSNIRSLAATVDRLCAATASPGPPVAGEAVGLTPLTPRQPSRPNLFMIPSSMGMILEFQQLMRGLDAEKYNFYSYQQTNYQDRDLLPDSIEALAAVYFREMIREQPDGPYHILGYSMGGIIAIEMAKLLEAKGGRADLILVDGNAVDKVIFKGEQGQAPQFAYEETMQQLAGTLGSSFRDDIERHRKLVVNNIELVNKYRLHGKIGADVHCFEARDNEHVAYNMQAIRRFVTGRFRHAYHPGTHHSILTGENAARLAAGINEILAETAPAGDRVMQPAPTAVP